MLFCFANDVFIAFRLGLSTREWESEITPISQKRAEPLQRLGYYWQPACEADAGATYTGRRGMHREGVLGVKRRM